MDAESAGLNKTGRQYEIEELVDHTNHHHLCFSGHVPGQPGSASSISVWLQPAVGSLTGVICGLSASVPAVVKSTGSSYTF